LHKLDILFPFHRNDNFFIEALNSILESKFKDYRLILIDDTIENSTKINFDFLTKKEIDYIYLRTPGNVGYGYSLKKGTEYIEAPFVALMNSDDCIHPERFSIQMEFIKDSDLNFCKMKKYSQTQKHLASLMGESFGPRYDPIFLLLGSYGANATWLMKSEWWLKNSFFDPYYGLDWRIALKTFPYSKISFTNLELYFYRSHKDQYSKKSRKRSEYDQIFSEWCEFAEKYNLGVINRELFDLIILPEMANSSQPYEALSNFSKAILDYTEINKIFIPDIVFKQLISRRMFIYSLTHLYKPIAVFKIYINNRKFLFEFIRDLCQIQLSNNRIINKIDFFKR
jgi:glycosyltransferase involved in cell wall biosynthesis